jgi:hypothetical protein
VIIRTHNHQSAQSRNLLFALLAFAIPLLVRAIPEILMGQYVTGFDSMAYYVPNTLEWLRNGVAPLTILSSAPLIYLMLMGITSIGAPIVISLKILETSLLGFLGLAIYFYANKALSWSPKKSLIVAILATLYFVSLRISWDMFRSELGLIFLFVMLILLQKNKISIKSGVSLAFIMFLIVFTHQLVAVIMFGIVITTVIWLLLRRKKMELGKLVLCAVPSAILFFSIIYINYFVYSEPLLGVSGNFSGGFEALTLASHTDLIVNTFGFLAFCYLPLLPLLIFGARHFRKSNLQLKAWVFWLCIPLLLVLVSSTFFSIGGVLPYRWVMLLTYPLAFYAVEGLSRIKRNLYKVGLGLGVGLILATLSVGFMVLPNTQALDYFGYYPQYIPKSMLQNTVQLSDCQDTSNALTWATNNLPANSSLLVHDVFYGWGALKFDSNRIILYYYGNPEETAQKLTESNPTSQLYLIWWVNGTGWYGQPTVPQSFNEIYHSGNIALYKYSLSQ